jgi:hypothetical protein
MILILGESTNQEEAINIYRLLTVIFRELALPPVATPQIAPRGQVPPATSAFFKSKLISKIEVAWNYFYLQLINLMLLVRVFIFIGHCSHCRGVVHVFTYSPTWQLSLHKGN